VPALEFIVRIALIVTGGVDRSGREKVTPALLWLIERLARSHELHVFALHYYREPCTYPLLGATVHDVGRVDGPRGLRRLRLRTRLARTLAGVGRFDVLHAYMGMPGTIVAPIAKWLGGPLVLTLDSGELVAIDDIAYGLQRRPVDRRRISRALRIAATVTVATEFMARQPALAGRTTTIVPIGIDANLFPLAARTDGPPWRLLRVASLNAVKDFPTLLQALRRIVDRGVDVHLDVVGEDTMKGSVQTLTESLGLTAHVTFHGVQPADQLAPFYARAHLHIVSSRHEAASVAVLEAAATGLPTVGTRVGYVADFAPDRAHAVPVGDAEALADAIIALLRDPEHRARLAARARSWTLAHDADWTAARFVEVYAAAATR
jgi:glycosyltransferase involved in cell wall biosynthesis